MNALSKDNKSVVISAVDLFCGVGGLTYGLHKSGINVAAGIDVDPTCRYAYNKNNEAEFIEQDIREITADDLNDFYPEGHLKLLAGCAPCQPFSSLPKNRRQPAQNDEKWNLLSEFGRLVEEVVPELITFENVPPIRHQNIYLEFLDKLKSLGYKFDSDIVYCPNYGVPQIRRRLVVIASILGKIDPLCETHSPYGHNGLEPYSTVRDTIGNLPNIAAGEKCETDKLHVSPRLLDKNIERIKQSKQGGTWDDWHKDLLAPCHKKASGQTYKSVYGRMKWDEPSPTITTQFHNYGSGRFGHPEQNRALSIREGALLQTFPKDYEFVDHDHPVQILQLGKHIGNAVPVKLATTIGYHIQDHVKDYYHD
ncbi:DNA cytosine methyltransferase [Candidatus Poribacteria bacterium]|nr:DNA cytosine methyltransferase [Candidatus Poribacteria bacterium]